uniref:Cu2_monoox_C domain-containing protein n=1 Tax=Macrostomum lignano TaxID=282301 RepID=A0A1I8FF58_9PLAT
GWQLELTAIPGITPAILQFSHHYRASAGSLRNSCALLQGRFSNACEGGRFAYASIGAWDYMGTFRVHIPGNADSSGDFRNVKEVATEITRRLVPEATLRSSQLRAVRPTVQRESPCKNSGSVRQLGLGIRLANASANMRETKLSACDSPDTSVCANNGTCIPGTGRRRSAAAPPGSTAPSASPDIDECGGLAASLPDMPSATVRKPFLAHLQLPLLALDGRGKTAAEDVDCELHWKLQLTNGKLTNACLLNWWRPTGTCKTTAVRYAATCTAAFTLSVHHRLVRCSIVPIVAYAKDGCRKLSAWPITTDCWSGLLVPLLLLCALLPWWSSLPYRLIRSRRHQAAEGVVAVDPSDSNRTEGQGTRQRSALTMLVALTPRCRLAHPVLEQIVPSLRLLETAMRTPTTHVIGRASRAPVFQGAPRCRRNGCGRMGGWHFNDQEWRRRSCAAATFKRSRVVAGCVSNDQGWRRLRPATSNDQELAAARFWRRHSTSIKTWRQLPNDSEVGGGVAATSGKLAGGVLRRHNFKAFGGGVCGGNQAIRVGGGRLRRQLQNDQECCGGVCGGNFFKRSPKMKGKSGGGFLPESTARTYRSDCFLLLKSELEQAEYLAHDASTSEHCGRVLAAGDAAGADLVAWRQPGRRASDSNVMDLLMPGEDTYLCTAVKLDKNRYIRAFNPQHQSGHAHHIILTACKEPGSATEKVWKLRRDAAPSRRELPVIKTYKQAPQCASDTRHPHHLRLRHGRSGFAAARRCDFWRWAGFDLPWLVVQVHYKKASDFVKNPSLKDNSGVHGRVVSGYRVRDGPLEPHRFGQSADAPDVLPSERQRRHQAWRHAGGQVRHGENTGDKDVSIGATQKDEMCNFYMMYWIRADDVGKDGSRMCYTSGELWDLARLA